MVWLDRDGIAWYDKISCTSSSFRGIGNSGAQA